MHVKKEIPQAAPLPPTKAVAGAQTLPSGGVTSAPPPPAAAADPSALRSPAVSEAGTQAIGLQRPTAGRTLGYRAADDPALAREYPLFVEFLTRTELEGKERETGTFILCSRDGEWSGCLSDRDTGLVLWRTGPTVASLMRAMEKALANPRADWRIRREYRAGKKS